MSICLVCGIPGKGNSRGVHKTCLGGYGTEELPLPTVEEIEAEITECGFECPVYSPFEMAWEDMEATLLNIAPCAPAGK